MEIVQNYRQYIKEIILFTEKLERNLGNRGPDNQIISDIFTLLSITMYGFDLQIFIPDIQLFTLINAFFV